MKISELTSGVRELWAFLWPPVALVVLLGAITQYIAPHSVNDSGPWLLDGSLRLVATVRPHLETFGLNILLPVVVLFAVVFALYVIQSIVFSVGEALPPGIAYRPDFLVVRGLDDAEIAVLWTKYPRETELFHLAQRLRAKDDENDVMGYWRKRSNAIGGRINAAKFVALWIVAVFLVELWNCGWETALLVRFLLVVVVWAFVIFMLLCFFLYAVQTQAYGALGVLKQFVRTNANKGEKQSISASDRAMLKSLRKEPWWNFDVEIWRYASWAYKNILRKGRADE
jgi:hypothetical protein